MGWDSVEALRTLALSAGQRTHTGSPRAKSADMLCLVHMVLQKLGDFIEISRFQTSLEKSEEESEDVGLHFQIELRRNQPH